MKGFAIPSLMLIAACAPAGDFVASQCVGDGVCVTATPVKGGVSIQVNNSSKKLVTIPELAGIGGPYSPAWFKIEPISYKGEARPPSLGYGALAGHGKITLMPNSWVGFFLSLKEVKELYGLRDGCQRLTIMYEIKEAGKDGLFGGPIPGNEFELCV